jgi:hypothetical protein
MPELYRIIKFKRNCGSCGGSLVQFQQGDAEVNALPFEIGKVLVMSDIRTDDVRGNHAHYETEEILVALTGGCVVDLDDGRGCRESVRLSAGACGTWDVERGKNCHEKHEKPPKESLSTYQLTTDNCGDIKEAILLYPHVWRTMRDFEPDTMLMVIANIKYDEADYIRNRVEFERISKSWNGLG